MLLWEIKKELKSLCSIKVVDEKRNKNDELAINENVFESNEKKEQEQPGESKLGNI